MLGAKYERLRRHLMALRFNEWRATFPEIEAILGFSLPPSARTHPAWWSNGDNSHSHASAWVGAGWKTSQLDLGSERVVFRRDADFSFQSGPAPVHENSSEIPNSNPSGLSPEAVAASNRTPHHAPTVVHEGQPQPSQPSCEPDDGTEKTSRYAFGFHWRPVGSVVLDEEGRLAFPLQPALPGIYRFQFRNGDGERCYIGETDNLSRRFNHYRNPGPTQQTNLRINALLLQALEQGAEIGVSAITAAWINSGPGREIADLSSKVVRRAIENIALIDCREAEIESLNQELTSGEPLSVTAQPGTMEPCSEVDSLDVSPIPTKQGQKKLPAPAQVAIVFAIGMLMALSVFFTVHHHH